MRNIGSLQTRRVSWSMLVFLGFGGGFSYTAVTGQSRSSNTPFPCQSMAHRLHHHHTWLCVFRGIACTFEHQRSRYHIYEFSHQCFDPETTSVLTVLYQRRMPEPRGSISSSGTLFYGRARSLLIHLRGTVLSKNTLLLPLH